MPMYCGLFLSFYKNVNATSLPGECMTKGECAIVFTDGPFSVTPEILDTFQNTKKKASFLFSLQHDTPQTQAIIKRAVDEGHTVGLRLDPGRDYSEAERENIELDINQQIENMDNITGESLTYITSTMGSDGKPDPVVYDYLYNKKLIQVGYSFCPFDDDQVDPVEATEKFFKRRNDKFDSFIILIYGNRLDSMDQLKEIMGKVTEKGFKLVTLDKCLDGYEYGTDITKQKKNASGVSSFLNMSFMHLLINFTL